jgi:hypothetical protein
MGRRKEKLEKGKEERENGKWEIEIRKEEIGKRNGKQLVGRILLGFKIADALHPGSRQS